MLAGGREGRRQGRVLERHGRRCGHPACTTASTWVGGECSQGWREGSAQAGRRRAAGSRTMSGGQGLGTPEPCGATAGRHAGNGTEEGHETSCGLGLDRLGTRTVTVVCSSRTPRPPHSIPSSPPHTHPTSSGGSGLLAPVLPLAGSLPLPQASPLPGPVDSLSPLLSQVWPPLCPHCFFLNCSQHPHQASTPVPFSPFPAPQLEEVALILLSREECSPVASPFLCYKDQTLSPTHQPFTAWPPRPPAHLSQCLPRMLRHSPTSIKTTGGTC